VRGGAEGVAVGVGEDPGWRYCEHFAWPVAGVAVVEAAVTLPLLPGRRRDRRDDAFAVQKDDWGLMGSWSKMSIIDSAK
jgi:hypothetical protein